MAKKMRTLGVGAGLVALMGCASTDPVYTQFYQESGAIVDTGSFGNATLNNRLVQTGERDFTINLARRFAAEIPTTVTFAFNSSRLDDNAKATLRRQADWIRQFPEIRFKVFGHTDKVGSAAYNRGLGKRRANAVVAYLSTQGINRSRLEAVVSFGETRPLILTDNRERRNRRTVTEVSGFVGRNPTPLDGKYAAIINREYVESATYRSTLSETELGQATQ
ncbi:OmpA family protein [Sulfitobacter sp. JB4-11]|uniref:OmpA family protein n=1 Tax=Sulfitobacter rhodophyticola TaxID=3238304 RepID=UPI003518CECD